MKTLIHFDNNPRSSTSLIKDNETLTAAFSEYGREIQTYDDGFGKLWAYSQEFGVMFVVRATSFESALECVYDELPPVPADELYEAYGFDNEEDFRKVQESDLVPDLAEGYSYQANFTGTGIVNHGYYEGLTEITNEIIASFKISVVVENW